MGFFFLFVDRQGSAFSAQKHAFLDFYGCVPPTISRSAMPFSSKNAPLPRIHPFFFPLPPSVTKRHASLFLSPTRMFFLCLRWVPFSSRKKGPLSGGKEFPPFSSNLFPPSLQNEPLSWLGGEWISIVRDCPMVKSPLFQFYLPSSCPTIFCSDGRRILFPSLKNPPTGFPKSTSLSSFSNVRLLSSRRLFFLQETAPAVPPWEVWRVPLLGECAPTAPPPPLALLPRMPDHPFPFFFNIPPSRELRTFPLFFPGKSKVSREMSDL